jgi:hypothetical protein
MKTNSDLIQTRKNLTILKKKLRKFLRKKRVLNLIFSNRIHIKLADLIELLSMTKMSQ